MTIAALVDVREALRLELLAHPLHVEAELARRIAPPRRSLLLLARAAGLEHPRCVLAPHDHDPVVVGDDHVAALDALPCARDRLVHGPQALLDRAERGDVLRPDREAHAL